MFDDDVFTQKKLKGCDYVFCAVEKKIVNIARRNLYYDCIFCVQSVLEYQ